MTISRKPLFCRTGGILPSARIPSLRILPILILSAVLTGCSGEPDKTESSATGENSGTSGRNGDGGQTAEKSPATPSGKTLPTASIPGKQPGGTTARKKPTPPAEGTPQWYIHQILLLRFEKYPQTDDVEKLRQLRRERNLKIVRLAEQCIARTHKDPELESVFNAAVHQLLEARVQLALQGKEEDIVELYDLAEVLFKRNPKSKAAAEAAYRVAVFANTNARRYPDPKTGWLSEFIRRARLFATDFPHERARAVRLLDVAGRSCESHRRIREAITVYEQLRTQFSDLPQAQRAVAVLRRLKLPGKGLQLAGPTIDGGFIDIKDYRGKVVLVVFWASDSKPCTEVLPQLKVLGEKYRPAGLEIIGVNLDKEEPVVDAYLEQSKLTWPQVFYPDRNKRRWDNLIARYYGVRELPTLWLVDRTGTVRDIFVDPQRLESRVKTLLPPRTAGRKSPLPKSPR